MGWVYHLSSRVILTCKGPTFHLLQLNTTALLPAHGIHLSIKH